MLCDAPELISEEAVTAIGGLFVGGRFRVKNLGFLASVFAKVWGYIEFGGVTWACCKRLRGSYWGRFLVCLYSRALPTRVLAADFRGSTGPKGSIRVLNPKPLNP